MFVVVAGGDAVDLFDVSMSAQLEALEAPGALEVEVQHPSGPTSAATLAGLRTGDLLLHGWDLARSCGGEEDLDDELVAEVWRVYQPRISNGSNRAGAFGDGR